MRDECPLSEVRAPSQHPPSRTSESHGLLTNLLILVPLYRSEVPDRIRRLWSRDFRSAVLDHDAIRWNRVMISFLCLSTIFSESPFPIFPDCAPATFNRRLQVRLLPSRIRRQQRGGRKRAVDDIADCEARLNA